jgi:hypothetical protein
MALSEWERLSLADRSDILAGLDEWIERLNDAQADASGRAERKEMG